MVDRDNIIDRLKQLGYEATEDDYDQIDFELNKIINYTLNYCRITTLPDLIDYRLTDRVCFEFLFYKKNSGQLVGFDYDVAIKSIREGDTQIQYAVGSGEDTPENRFDTMVRQLERGYDKWITRYRRITF